MPRLYSEVMRACLITLNDVLGTSIESQWGAFTFLKVPHILRQLHFTIRGGQIGHTGIVKGNIALKVVTVAHISVHKFAWRWCVDALNSNLILHWICTVVA